MRNRKTGYCCWCGVRINPNEGNLVHVGAEDENLGFGPMGMTGWLVSCLDRAACRGRVAEEKTRAQAERDAAQRANDRERALFPREEGEYVRPPADGTYQPGYEKLEMPAGTRYERAGKGHDIYGYGTCYLDDSESIWQIRNNGSDGADWAHNNIRTGGAGAIGLRFARTGERLSWLAEQVNVTAREAAEKTSRQAERDAEIQGLRAMLARVGGWDELDRKLRAGEKGKTYDSFCPQELQHLGRKYTIASAKRILDAGS